jgi:hypothetical protein
MRLTESMNRHQTCKETNAPRKPRQTNVAMVQDACIPSEPLQGSSALLAANLQNRGALAIRINRRQPQATWPKASTCLQGTATCNLAELRREILDVLGTRALLGQDYRTAWAKVRPDAAQGRTTKRHRPAIHGFPGAGRHHLEGGETHVLAVTSSAHSQAPPIPLTDAADRQDCDIRTAT